MLRRCPLTSYFVLRFNSFTTSSIRSGLRKAIISLFNDVFGIMLFPFLNFVKTLSMASLSLASFTTREALRIYVGCVIRIKINAAEHVMVTQRTNQNQLLIHRPGMAEKSKLLPPSCSLSICFALFLVLFIVYLTKRFMIEYKVIPRPVSPVQNPHVWNRLPFTVELRFVLSFGSIYTMSF